MYKAPDSGCNPLQVQCKMHNHKDGTRYSKDDMQAIWNPHDINIIANVERPCDRTENIGCDKGKPHDPVYNAIGAQLFRHPTQRASAQSLEPTPVHDNVDNNPSETRHPKTDMGSDPHAVGKPKKDNIQLVGDDEPQQESSYDCDQKGDKESYIEPEVMFSFIHCSFTSCWCGICEENT